jgi:hypothetical protein
MHPYARAHKRKNDGFVTWERVTNEELLVRLAAQKSELKTIYISETEIPIQQNNCLFQGPLKHGETSYLCDGNKIVRTQRQYHEMNPCARLRFKSMNTINGTRAILGFLSSTMFSKKKKIATVEHFSFLTSMPQILFRAGKHKMN